MKNYLVTHRESKRTMAFTYDLNGFFTAFKCNFKMSKALVIYFENNFPFEECKLDQYRTKEFKVELIKQDLSFKTFWEAYAHKVGNKTRAKKLWEALKDIDKLKALSYIPKYNQFLIQQNNNISRLYPETYLSQKRFDNE